MNSYTKFIALIIFSVISSCDMPVKGQFGFAATDDRGIEEPERSRLTETEFNLVSDQLHFYSHETIWWIYKIESGRYTDEDLLMILYTDNNTPTPVEQELRRVKTQKSGDNVIIRDYFRNLEPGKYILAIAHKSLVVDKVEFKVHRTPDITGGTYDPEWDKEFETQTDEEF
jgi:hypothetical protein